MLKYGIVLVPKLCLVDEQHSAEDNLPHSESPARIPQNLHFSTKHQQSQKADTRRGKASRVKIFVCRPIVPSDALPLHWRCV